MKNRKKKTKFRTFIVTEQLLISREVLAKDQKQAIEIYNNMMNDVVEREQAVAEAFENNWYSDINAEAVVEDEGLAK